MTVIVSATASPIASPSAGRGGPSHIPALDGLRGMAILLVLLWHFGPVGHAVRPALTTIGWTGVDLFFVLSGFLITRILRSARGSTHFFRNFYARRTLRIFPLYYGVLIAVYLVYPLLRRQPPGPMLRESGWWLFAYLGNVAVAVRHDWLSAPWPLAVGHLWSLAVEEQFYLVWPLLVLTCSPKTDPLVMRVFMPIQGKEILDEFNSQEASFAGSDHRAPA